MERRRMIQQRLVLAAEAAAAAVLCLLLFCTDHGSNVGSLPPAYTAAPEVSCAKNLSYGTELRVRDSCADPGAAHAAGAAGDVTLPADFVVGMIGRPRNPVFQESNLTQCSTPSYCAFSILTLSQVHALMQSYTVNLSSMLTAKRFRPLVTDLDQLLTDGDYNGYQSAGFICPFLMNKGIKEDRLNPYNNQTKYSKALCKGSKNGGGSATVDEIPYLSFFRSDEHCKAYDMVVVIPYGSPGLGFGFPDKSYPLLHNVSVDNISEGSNFLGPQRQTGREEEGARRPGASIRRTIKAPLSPLEPSPSLGRPSPKFNAAVGDIEVPYPFGVPYPYTAPKLRAAHNDSKSPIEWTFLRPLTKELWLTTVCFVLFTGFVVWMIERPINPVFQGSSLTQVGTALYFAFSTLTFTHGQSTSSSNFLTIWQILRSPLSKIVLVVWCFAVLVLVQSYITNLSTMITAEASTNNGSSAAGWVPLTLRSFSGLFVVVGCISAFMLLISFARSVYANYTRVRGSESQSAGVDGGSVRTEGFIGTPQNGAANRSVPDQPVQEVRDNDSQGAQGSSGSSGDEEAGPVEDSKSNGSQPVPQVSVQIEMTSKGNAVRNAI